jgi:hypothetical protein
VDVDVDVDDRERELKAGDANAGVKNGPCEHITCAQA